MREHPSLEIFVGTGTTSGISSNFPHFCSKRVTLWKTSSIDIAINRSYLSPEPFSLEFVFCMPTHDVVAGDRRARGLVGYHCGGAVSTAYRRCVTEMSARLCTIISPPVCTRPPLLLHGECFAVQESLAPSLQLSVMPTRSYTMDVLMDKSPTCTTVATSHITYPGNDLVLDGGASLDEDDIVEQPMRYYFSFMWRTRTAALPSARNISRARNATLAPTDPLSLSLSRSLYVSLHVMQRQGDVCMSLRWQCSYVGIVVLARIPYPAFTAVLTKTPESPNALRGAPTFPHHEKTVCSITPCPGGQFASSITSFRVAHFPLSPLNVWGRYDARSYTWWCSENCTAHAEGSWTTSDDGSVVSIPSDELESGMVRTARSWGLVRHDMHRQR